MFANDAPDYNAPAMDAGGRRAIDRVTQGALNATPESEAAAFGAPDTRGLMADDGSFDRGIGMDPTMAAVKQRSMRDFDQSQAKLKSDIKFQSRNSYFDRLTRATQLAQDEQALNFQREMAKRKAKEAKKQARGAMIGSVLGIVGGVAGTVFGGPAGGMAGMQAGSAVGNSVGRGM